MEEILKNLFKFNFEVNFDQNLIYKHQMNKCTDKFPTEKR